MLFECLICFQRVDRISVLLIVWVHFVFSLFNYVLSVVYLLLQLLDHILYLFMLWMLYIHVIHGLQRKGFSYYVTGCYGFLIYMYYTFSTPPRVRTYIPIIVSAL